MFKIVASSFGLYRRKAWWDHGASALRFPVGETGELLLFDDPVATARLARAKVNRSKRQGCPILA